MHIAHLSLRRALPVVLLILILLSGFGVRLHLAPLYGYPGDKLVHRGWMRSATILGVVPSFYAQLDDNRLPDHGPMEIVLFAAAGHLYKWLISPTYKEIFPIVTTFAELPAILCDLINALLLYLFVRRVFSEKKALIAAAVCALHPTMMYDSSVWGQTDAVYTMFLLASLLFFIHEQWLVSGVLFVAAVASKPPAIALMPLMVMLAIRRRRAFISMAVGAVLFATLIVLLFGRGEGFARLTYSGRSDLKTLSAFNPWWLLSHVKYGLFNPIRMVYPYAYRYINVIVFGAFSAGMLFRLRKVFAHPSVMLLTASLLAYGFYLMSPEAHAHHGVAALVFGVPIIFFLYEGPVLYSLMSLSVLLNMAGRFGEARRVFYAASHLADAIAVLQMILLVALIRLVLRVAGSIRQEQIAEGGGQGR